MRAQAAALAQGRPQLPEPLFVLVRHLVDFDIFALMLVLFCRLGVCLLAANRCCSSRTTLLFGLQDLVTIDLLVCMCDKGVD
jgi:hypothetical protein